MKSAFKIIPIYPAELQLDKDNSSDTEAPFLFYLNLSISTCNGTVFTKIYDKRDCFDFDVVHFLFLDGDVSRRISYRVYIYQLHGSFCKSIFSWSYFISMSKQSINCQALKQGYRYHKLRKAFSNRHSELMGKYNVNLKKLLQQSIVEPEFHGVLVYRIRKHVGKSIQLKKS